MHSLSTDRLEYVRLKIKDTAVALEVYVRGDIVESQIHTQHMPLGYRNGFLAVLLKCER